MNLKKIDIDISKCDRKSLLKLQDYVSKFAWTELFFDKDLTNAYFMVDESFDISTLKLPEPAALRPWVSCTQKP